MDTTMEGTRQTPGVESRDRPPVGTPGMQAVRPSTTPANQRWQTMGADELPPPRPKTDTALPLARGLGWFSIGLGLAELVAPRQLARFIGVTDNTTLIQAMGVR